jgi:Stress responsive A/B Barrel Domain
LFKTPRNDQEIMMNPKEKPYRHVVLFRFFEKTTEATVQSIEKAFREMASGLPFVKGFEWGRNSSPEGLDLGFSHCFVVTFGNAAGRDQYLPHPDHQAFCRQYLDPNLEKVCVVDFLAEE